MDSEILRIGFRSHSYVEINPMDTNRDYMTLFNGATQCFFFDKNLSLHLRPLEIVLFLLPFWPKFF